MKYLRIHYFASIIVGIFLISCAGNKTEQKKQDAFSFVFMTDIHLEPGRSAPEGLKQALDSVATLHPDFILTGGDLVMDALGATRSRADSLFELYLSIMKSAQIPVYNTNGNHDNLGWEKPELVDRNDAEFGRGIYKKYIGDPYYTFDHKGWRFFVLCSAQQTPTGYTGEIDSVQLNWLKKKLDETDTTMPLAISLHIPLLTVYSQMEEGTMAANTPGLVTSNGKEVLDLFSHHNLRLVLQGHLHYLEEIKVKNITFITGGAVSSRWWLGKYKGLEEGFLELTLQGNAVRWRYVDYGWNAGS